MKTRPILFTGEMVRAILAGRKTQTRRVVSPQPAEGTRRMYPIENEDFSGEAFFWVREFGKAGGFNDGANWTDNQPWNCPYGIPGDRLWVRETWYCDDYRVQKGPYLKPEDWDAEQQNRMMYFKATDDAGNGHFHTGFSGETAPCQWRPSIHLPKWAARIWLEVVSVRVERLQEINAVDSVAEGISVGKGLGMIEGEDCYMMTTNSGYMRGPLGAIMAYRDLWKSINGVESWTANPWVWVIEFRRTES